MYDLSCRYGRLALRLARLYHFQDDAVVGLPGFDELYVSIDFTESTYLVLPVDHTVKITLQHPLELVHAFLFESGEFNLYEPRDLFEV